MATTESLLASLLNQAQNLTNQIASLTAEIARLSLEPQPQLDRIASLEDARQQLRIELNGINAQIAQLQADQNGRTSSGEIVGGAQAGRDDRANETNPPFNYALVVNGEGRIQLPPDTQSGSNAQKFTLPDINYGLNDPVKTLTLTQGTQFIRQGGEPQLRYYRYQLPRTTVNEDQGSGAPGSQPQPGGEPGAGSASDDQGTPAGGSPIVAALNSIDYTEKIVAQDNILDGFNNYTYQASLYLCTKQQYQRMINTGQKVLSGAQLLIQSGGANISNGSRDPNFGLDFYIDRIEMKSFFAGKAVRLAHNVKEVRMTVIEPGGITLLDRLKNAVNQFLPSVNGQTTYSDSNTIQAPGSKGLNFTAQIYLLVIRFYGYDELGNPVRVGRTSGTTTDPNAVVEKWYPLILSRFNFKVGSKLTEYDLEFKAPPYYIAASSQRGTLPFNVELSGGTVKDLLAGPTVSNAGQVATNQVIGGSPLSPPGSNSVLGGLQNGQFSSFVSPPKAGAATSTRPTVRQGVMTALNLVQQQLVKDGLYQYPDEYNIEFALDAMASATVYSPGTSSVNKSATAMAVPTTAAEAKLGTKSSMDPTSRIEGAYAGTQIVQFIDLVMRNSSYIKDQALVVIDENSGVENPSNLNVKNMSWYKIGFRAEAKLDQYDEKRQDYAYKITYVVSPYKIAQLNSPYFPQPVFNGVHKTYKYWFTGENTQVLNYEENLNSLYYVVMSGTNLSGISSAIDAEQKFSYQTASGQASQGAEAKTLEPAANAADQLYNPADLKSCKITILGDPAWLQQGEAFVGLKKGQSDYFSAFLADGTINFDSQQILFEVAYNTSIDYNLETGLMEINRGQLDADKVATQSQTNTGNPANKASRVYIAKQCVSEFNRGKFTQTLEGSLRFVYKPPLPTTTATDTNRNAKTSGAQINYDEVYQGALTKGIPKYAQPTSVTGQTPTSAVAKGVQQILRPPSQLDEPTLAQLTASPVYIQSRLNGATPQAALEAARAAFASGTNNYSRTAVPGIMDTSGTLQRVVKDGNPG
jgi:hypothetical protein